MSDRPMPSSFDDDKEYQETGFKKITRKLREEPLIPLGTALTCLALYNAWRAMRRGDHAQVQRMFRARIGAQAFTVCAIVAGGAYYGADRDKRAELIKLEAQQRAEERHARWLKELEVRDDEEKQLRAAMKRKSERVAARKAEEKEKAATEKAAAEGKTGSVVEEVKGEAKSLKAEVTGDAEGQVPAQGDKDGSKVLGALSEAGGWFGTKGGKDDGSSTKIAEKKAEKTAEKEAKPEPSKK
ncbi:hypoxia induced protein conserved region-domain-containing protein [Xylariaceae sp. FL0016]|nr:hypoxia induced protein conserved region-domain-containing protein [Xylariaceae sp. FL0016]